MHALRKKVEMLLIASVEQRHVSVEVGAVAMRAGVAALTAAPG